MSICDFVVSKDEALALQSSSETEFIDAQYLDHRPWLYPYGLDFNKYIQTYYEYFGKENCCVVLFEELKNSQEMQLEKILRFFTGSADDSVIEKTMPISEYSFENFMTHKPIKPLGGPCGTIPRKQRVI